MSYETYINLLRVAEKRKRAATYSGNWQAVAEACAEIERLHTQYAKESSSG